MTCTKCGMSVNNSVHRRKTQYGYHEFVESLPGPYVKSLEDRVSELETRVTELEQRLGTL